ncbi:hypothetical protein ARMGADRAFT_1029406 [Armillaria gallica]|uniref:Uncharacterized protein n=1 Tax=Armillaria gallica TaxID=47427 RepID=A0A2H3DK80_ARMGA|nr:hypothetical protein ARMGADRAFT_1029406 [Armillaria gallica]
MQRGAACTTFTPQGAYTGASSALSLNFDSDVNPFTLRPLQQTTGSLYPQIPLTATPADDFFGLSSHTVMGGNYDSHCNGDEHLSWQNHDLIPMATPLDEYPCYEASNFGPANATSTPMKSQVCHDSRFPSLRIDVNLAQQHSPAAPIPYHYQLFALQLRRIPLRNYLFTYGILSSMHGVFNTDDTMNLSWRGCTGSNSMPKLNQSADVNDDSPYPGMKSIRSSPWKKSGSLACFFCRVRKTACGRPMEGSADMMCNVLEDSLCVSTLLSRGADSISVAQGGMHRIGGMM